MRVEISELRRAANALFDHLEDNGHSEIELDEDYYWHIPREKLYSVYEAPSDFSIGQLSDDLEEVRKVASGESPISFALVWLAPILRYIGEKVVA